jgi:diaminopimelate decarboxylase
VGFSFQDGTLYGEQLAVADILNQVQETPFYLYSAARLRHNVQAYRHALSRPDIPPGRVYYALKANNNLTLLRLLHENGCGATTVSGNEIHLALAAGFAPARILFNGNGKTPAELEFAIEQGVMLNVDSAFDLENIGRAARTVGATPRGRPATGPAQDRPLPEQPRPDTVDVLLRLNPAIDPQVHPYNATGLRASKFGIPPARIPWFLNRLREMPRVRLVGLHCHLGSTITQVAVFRDAARLMAGYYQEIAAQGFPLRFLNLGGGLGLAPPGNESVPTPADLVAAIQDFLPPGATLILEPGRSIVGDAGILVCRVIGVKDNGYKRFIVTDGSMAELIRPSLYDAHHDIAFITPVAGEPAEFDIVGPVCESGDFLGKDRRLPAPPAGIGIAIFHAGAYGYAMSSNYNARLRPAEYLVDGEQLTMIRRPERLEQFLDQMRVGGRSGS